MRRRRSVSASSDTSTRNGRIAAFSTGFTSAAALNGVPSGSVAVRLAIAGGTRLPALSGAVEVVSRMVILQDEGGGKATNRQESRWRAKERYPTRCLYDGHSTFD